MDKIISVYTREQAIKDGILVDVSDTAEVKEAGFKIPVCVTAHLWEKITKLGEDNYKGRLWDVVFMAAVAFRKKKDDLVEFEVLFEEDYPKSVKLWLVFNSCEGFTIMYPEDY